MIKCKSAESRINVQKCVTDGRADTVKKEDKFYEEI